jgi:hypothetical protein
VIDLGVALEFTTSQYWVVGLAVMAALDERRLAQLDELTRKLLENRMAVMTREIQQALPKALRLGDVLMAVAARNPWSIYVDAPHSLVLSASEQKAKASDKVSAEKLTEQYVYKVLDVTREKLRGSVHDDQGQTDVPWMVSPKSVILPLTARS